MSTLTPVPPVPPHTSPTPDTYPTVIRRRAPDAAGNHAPLHDPDDDITFRALDAGNAEFYKAFRSRGTLAGWLKSITPLAPYPVPTLLIGASLAAPLLRILELSSFGVDLCCRTSQGKTLTARVAARVWGNAEPGSDSLLCSWDTTPVGIERRASMLAGVPLFIDDSRNANPRIIDAVIYGISNNMGRTRGSRRGLAATAAWETILISTGESPLTSLSGQHKGGKNVRIISIDRTPYGPAPASAVSLALVNALESSSRLNYGHAGPTFVQYLVDHEEDWGAYRERHSSIASSYLTSITGEAARVANSCACIALAIEIGVLSHALPPTFTDPFTSLWPDVSRHLVHSNPAEQALFDIYGWAVANSPSFYGQTDYDKRRPRYGQWSEPYTHLNVFPQACKDALQSCGHDHAAVLREWNDRGWLDCSASRPFQKRIKCQGAVTWVVSIKKSALQDAGVIQEDTTGFEEPIQSYDEGDSTPF